MSVHLPTPYPDELLYGVISRLVTQTGWSGRMASTQVFGAPLPCSVDLPGMLDAVAANAGPSLSLTGDGLLRGTTLFPFYAAGAPPAVAAEVACALTSGPGRGAHARLGLPAQSIKRPRELRFCPACRDEDLHLLGETYWRRAHQLPGVLACPRHPRMLVGTGIPMSQAMTGTYHDASAVTGGVAEAERHVDAAMVALAHEAAARCAALLDAPPTCAGVDDFRGLALRKGLCGGKGGIDHVRMGRVVASHVGARFLAAIGLAHEGSASGLYWVRRQVVGYGQSVCPTTGVLVSMALEALPDQGLPPAAPRGRTPAAQPRRPGPGELPGMRARWRRLFSNAEAPKVTRARRTHGYLAARLRFWDRAWYDAFNARHHVRREGASPRSRDRDMLRALQAAERRLRAAAGSPRRSRSAILASAGVHRDRVRGMPRCEAFLSSRSETTLDHRRRKLECAAAVIAGRGRRPTASSLAEVSGLGWGAVVDPALDALVRALCGPHPWERDGTVS
ncbi:TniQ family protein [Lichenihabitans sp. Uapishka_5]|uniref:TniQ family protein n=1 Tax=Lichenihabitans sp. Uapishka_5 TaxID=3037302 RepID=UPI0029E7D341|nr:TniQ family protein [Lichenihabitans sp. Uapishka_5]MDX7951630.1 TniQ family protein [Lichenihabitans sp. Uapishka_5]